MLPICKEIETKKKRKHFSKRFDDHDVHVKKNYQDLFENKHCLSWGEIVYIVRITMRTFQSAGLNYVEVSSPTIHKRNLLAGQPKIYNFKLFRSVCHQTYLSVFVRTIVFAFLSERIVLQSRPLKQFNKQSC